MHTPGFTWYTAPLPSRASSLLQVHLPTCPPTRPVHHHFCGSWLASDAYTGIFLIHPTAAIASKLAPTGAPAHLPTHPASEPHFCGSWLASDAYTGIFLIHPTAAIASKLAPTGPSAHLPTHPASEPSLLWAQGCQPTLARALSRRSGLRENTWLAQPLRSLAASMALRMASSTASAAATNNGEM